MKTSTPFYQTFLRNTNYLSSGDLNGRVGCDFRAWEDTMSKHGIGESDSMQLSPSASNLQLTQHAVPRCNQEEDHFIAPTAHVGLRPTEMMSK